MSVWFEDVELEGEFVKLVPLNKGHSQELVDAANDGELWKLWYTSVPSKDSIKQYVDTALEQRENNQSLPFVVIRKSDAKVIGCTRFCHAEPQNKRVEIGYTWYSKSAQRSSINSETKLLLLTYAFETLGACVVVFQTHWHNIQSRNAIARLGAKQDGVIRNHRIIDGIPRDTVIFSILNSEWLAVKQSLEFKVGN
ncbi:MAG: GNAT family N-acetyltransferase [Kangiellaceae bacterium]|nr:GNAT family N-acetyltransferase [Kangiellaceae bacterium]MCW9015441.1 GNAT family N-acetyltransferase [Kangiellaceae bacterium]